MLQRIRSLFVKRAMKLDVNFATNIDTNSILSTQRPYEKTGIDLLMVVHLEKYTPTATLTSYSSNYSIL